MNSLKSYRAGFKASSITFLLLAGILILPLFTLIQPTWSQPPWWNTNWNFRKQITLNHLMVKADLEDFPVLIDIFDSDLKSKTQSDGDDIAFTANDNDTLSHEIELYDPNSGHLVVWVKIPLLSSTIDTELFMYYGNPSAPNQQKPQAVWNSNFTAVQHLKESSTTRYDSTANLNHGTTYGGIKKSNVGKIDGTDEFDGINDYTSIASSPSLNPSIAITVELWVNLSSTGNYMSLVGKDSYGQYYLRVGKEVGRAYWIVRFGDGTYAIVEGNIGWTWNAWHHIVATLDTQSQMTKIYLDGIEKLNGTFGPGKNIVTSTKPVLISDVSSKWLKGSVDEVRISNVSRSAAWIQTCSNNQKDAVAFYAVENEEVNSFAPLVFETPSNEANNVYTNPTLHVQVADPTRQNMTIFFKERVANEWKEIKTYENIPDGSYSAVPTNMTILGTTYYWAVCVTNGAQWTNKTYTLTTTTKILQQKWGISGAPKGVSGVLAADINGDGIDEVIHGGKGGVVALNGSDGRVIWNYSDTTLNSHCQIEMADLNHDGIPEIIAPIESPAGILALYATGNVYWRTTGLGGDTYSGPVVFDIDGNGYPTIFVGSTDIMHGLNGEGRITALSYDGRILQQVFSWRPCSGGLSIGDTNGDGEFELYMGDRYAYLNGTEWVDNNYGKGVQSYWARNLTLRWSRPDIFCSSQKPMLADIDNDGILDVVVGDLNGGLAVLNATDGSTIRMSLNIPNDAPTHYQPSIYDIDRDGNLEMLMADPEDATSDDLVVWDLVKWRVDARLYLGKNFYGPQIADVTGDGKMEIIAINYKSIFVIDSSYRVLDGIAGLSGEIVSADDVRDIDGISGQANTLNYAVVQDIDGDGYNELITSAYSGVLYAFDTPARRWNPRPRSEVQFYSEYRLGVAEYVQPQGGPTPVIYSSNPSNMMENVPLSLSSLEFTLTDYQNEPMNYTVATYPDIGSGAGTNVSNGRYAVSISYLAPSTTYTWNVTATDGIHQSLRVFAFKTESFFSWWNEGWKYRKRIAIDHSKVDAGLSNFPLLIDITDSDLVNKTQLNGGDIVFTDLNNNQLDHEIESYSNANGHLVAWLRVPIVSSTTDVVFYMYYGNPSAGNQQKPQLVWDSGFVMVQHLEELAGIRNDSTLMNNNGLPNGGVSKAVVGRIDGADTFDGVTGSMTVANRPSLNPSSAITIDLWMNLSSTSNYINVVSKGEYSQYLLRLGKAEGYTYWCVKFTDGTSKTIEGNAGWKWNTWHHLVATLDTQTPTTKLYLDGIEKFSGTFSPGKTLMATSNPVLISGLSRQIKGSVDEIRISNVSRSAAWIRTSSNNQKDPAAFYTVGNEEVPLQVQMVFDPLPAQDATNVSPSLSELSFNMTSPTGQLMNYTVTTYPNIGSGSGTNASSGRFAIPVVGLQYSSTYKWTIEVTDGINSTKAVYTFTTYPSEPPIQDEPILVLNPDGSITCYNQSTNDPDDSKVTNIYNWYRNNTPTANLILPFETNSSTTTRDYSGYGNDGLIIRGATWTDSGKVGGAYKLDRGYIQVPGSNTLDGGGSWTEITIEHWIYLTSPQTGTVRTISRMPSYEIGISGNSIFASIWVVTGSASKSGLNRISYATTLRTNTWYHIALTYKSGVALTLYLNGTAVASTLVTGNIQPSGFNPLDIGWFDYFKGIIDEVRIYPESLSAQQVYQRYIETNAGSSSSATIVSQETNVGETWECLVTPNDSHQDGTAKFSNTITIGYNNKPIAKSITITPITPRTNEDLVGSYTYFDPDGDPENETEIRWYKNDILQPDLNNTLTVPAALTTRDEIWHFTVRPYDGEEFGAIQTSPNVTVRNTPPSITNVQITPDPADENSTLAVDIFGWVDPDGDSQQYVYQWQRYTLGEWIDIEGATYSTLGPEYFQSGDSIRVLVTPFDGLDFGETRNYSVSISS